MTRVEICNDWRSGRAIVFGQGCSSDVADVHNADMLGSLQA